MLGVKCGAGHATPALFDTIAEGDGSCLKDFERPATDADHALPVFSDAVMKDRSMLAHAGSKSASKS
eukprot:10892602-Karenia_brevis.AAC.1